MRKSRLSDESRNSRAGRRLVLFGAASVIAYAATILVVPATAYAGKPTINSVTFSGTSAAPTVTVTGSGFGTAPAPTSPDCAYEEGGPTPSGSDYSSDALYLQDLTSHSYSPSSPWFAGGPGNCVGLVVSTYQSGKIVFTFNNYYGEEYGYVLQADDQISMTVAGTTYQESVRYPSERTETQKLSALLQPGVLGGGTGGEYISPFSGPVPVSGNAKFQFEPASNIKVFIALYAMTQVSEGLANLTDPIPTLSLQCVPTETGTLPLWQDIQQMMQVSSNDATFYLEYYFGVSKLNAFVASLGLTGTHFSTIPGPPGFLAVDSVDGNCGSCPSVPTTLDCNVTTLHDASIAWLAAAGLKSPFNSEFFELVQGREDNTGDYQTLESIAQLEAPLPCRPPRCNRSTTT